MGGLVVRQFLLNKQDRLGKVPLLYFYATPTNGAELAKIAKDASSNPQLRGMLPLEGNDLLQSIQSNWLGSKVAKAIPSYCAFETLPTLGFMVVSRSSATALCNQDLNPMSANHIDIVKPRDREDSRYTRFTSALRKQVEVVGVQKSAVEPLPASVQTSSQDEKRAWVGVSSFTPDCKDENGSTVYIAAGCVGKIRVTLTNTGKSPASEVTHQSKIIYAETLRTIDVSKELLPHLEPSKSVLFAGQSIISDHILAKLKPITSEDLIATKSGSRTMYVIGEIGYLDVLKRKHLTTYCAYVDNATLRSMVHCPFGNDAH